MDANDSPTKVEMPITDEDLARLKEWMKEHRPILSGTLVYAVAIGTVARLEAAEKVIQAQLLVCQDHREDEEYSDGIETKAEQAYDVWISTAGKSPVVRDPI